MSSFDIGSKRTRESWEKRPGRLTGALQFFSQLWQPQGRQPATSRKLGDTLNYACRACGLLPTPWCRRTVYGARCVVRLPFWVSGGDGEWTGGQVGEAGGGLRVPPALNPKPSTSWLVFSGCLYDHSQRVRVCPRLQGTEGGGRQPKESRGLISWRAYICPSTAPCMFGSDQTIQNQNSAD